MFHKVVAAEQKDQPNFTLVNYAPGPLDTDMQKEIREGANVDPATQQFFITMKADNQLVSVKDSAVKLVRCRCRCRCAVLIPTKHIAGNIRPSPSHPTPFPPGEVVRGGST